MGELTRRASFLALEIEGIAARTPKVQCFRSAWALEMISSMTVALASA
jgi:hypothetical protein